MSASGGPTVIDGAGGTGSAPEERELAKARGPAWVPVIPAVVTFAVTMVGINVPSFSRDEAATLGAVHRTFPQLIKMLGNVDVVHGEYYALIWVVAHVAGTSELAVRTPSALAMALAAGAVAALGQRLVSLWAGLAAGLVFAILPTVSWFAENARDGALITGLGALATYFFVRAAEAGARRRRWLIAYGVAMAALGFGNVFALLLILAHGVTLACWLRSRRAGRSAGAPAAERGGDRSLILGWLVAVVAAAVVVSPVAVVGSAQLHQIHWLKRTNIYEVESVRRLVGPTGVLVAAAVIVAASIVVAALGGRARLRARWPSRLVTLCLPWLLLPPALLLLVSAFHPVYTFRYILFCMPAVALLLGAALAALGRYLGPVALVVLVLLGLHAQIGERGPAGHGVNVRYVNHVVAIRAEPGDGLLNVTRKSGRQKGTGERTLEAAYPYGLSRLRDVTAGVSAARAGDLGGTYAPVAVVHHRLTTLRRLWVVEWNAATTVRGIQGLGFKLQHSWLIRNISLRLYVRSLGTH
ncbi:MAG TPA: glycosyltransferase family 39 protein [Streptosporangiaceae bacterium]|nr:glycosyltransferase family 39 protein [Streptosporangiaceae bacterium]